MLLDGHIASTLHTVSAGLRVLKESAPICGEDLGNMSPLSLASSESDQGISHALVPQN